MLEWANEDQIRGEFCLVVEGNQGAEPDEEEKPWWAELSEKEHVEHYINEGSSSKQAIKQTAVDRDVPKREIYDAYHIQS